MRPLFALLILVCLVPACEMERDNLLDPKNPDSETEKTVLAEVFVNTNVPSSNDAIQALENLEIEFGGRLLILEYHLSNSSFPDPFGTEDADLRYETLRPGEDKIVPRCFINAGTIDFIGASSTGTAQSRYLEAINDAISGSGKILIEAEKEVTGSSIDITVRIARLGDTPLSNSEVIVVSFEDLQQQGNLLSHTVRDYVPNVRSISLLENGDIIDFDVSLPVTGYDDPSTASIVIIVQNATSHEILQAQLVM